jgi:malate dehydrogenase (quinone)
LTDLCQYQIFGMAKHDKEQLDFALIGGGIMSATLAVLLHELMPNASMAVFERLDIVAEESSDAWNNAGTGHAAFCELNYTPEKEDGSIDCSKAIKIAEQFELSKQFWAYLVQENILLHPNSFISQVPHYSFVHTADDCSFLKKRFHLLSQQPLFAGMQYSEDPEILHQWFPLIMQGRSTSESVAATKMDIGTDVNFGAITDQLFSYLQSRQVVNVHLQHEVKDIDRNDNGSWEIEVKDLLNDEKRYVDARFVFVGAGGGSLKLLNKAEIDEVDGYGGFPVGGKWLKCKNPAVIARHAAKVYGKAAIGAPPMSVPHLDTRIINGQKEMLFGPYAGFSTKFLKHGSYWDLPASLDFDNVLPMIQVGMHNIPLTKYLIQQVRMGFDEKLDAMREYYPDAQADDWELVEAGQRVQVIKKDEHGEGVLEFGTELIHTKDGSLAGLLGASPGASTAVSIMLNLLAKCFPQQMASVAWQEKLIAMMPGFGKNLNEHAVLLNNIRQHTKNILQA